MAGPAVASVVLHGALLALIARVTLPPLEDAGNAERLSVKVVVATRHPPPSLPEAGEIPSPETPATGADAAEASQATVESAAAPTEQDALAERADDLPEADVEALAEAWTPARIRSAIDTHASVQRSTATTDWLTACFVEQKQHGTRDCVRQLEEQDHASAGMRAGRMASRGAFAGVVRPDNDWRRVQEFMRSNALMEDLADQGGAVGALARDRILLGNEYMRFLTGNGQDPLWAAMNSGFTADVLGGPRLSLPGNIPFQCRKRVAGTSDTVAAPCVYVFNGFTIERPDVPLEANHFSVVPVVPGSRQKGQPGAPANPVTP